MSASVPNSLPATNLVDFSPAAASDGMPTSSDSSFSGRADPATSISLTESAYSIVKDFKQLNSELGTFADGISPSLLADSILSPASSGVTRGNSCVSTAVSCLENASYGPGASMVPDVERVESTSSESESPRTTESRRSTLSIPSSPATSSPVQLQGQNQSPHRQPGPCQTPRIQSNSSGTTNPVGNAASRNILREDYRQFLETKLPQWKEDALWSDAQFVKSTVGSSAFQELELAYSSVCQLDIRMEDDAIRNRVALIRLQLEYTKAYKRQSRNSHAKAIGRGGASVIIDAILESIHGEWNTFDSRRKSDLRVKFHNRKRYGKRWLLVTKVLGPSILLLCSTKLGNMM